MTDISSIILDKIEIGGELFSQGKEQEGIDIYLSIFYELDNLVHKKYKIDETHLLIMCIYNAYFLQGNYAEAKKWADEQLKCERPDYDVSPYINMGRVCFELGETDEAYKNFLAAYQRGKYRAFQGEEPKYWEFFKSIKSK